jgi:hypothetical protein
MSKLRPLLKNDATEAEKWLLRSARLDVPSRSSKRRVLAALGFAAAATTAASTSGVAAAATVSVGWVIKCIVVGAVSGVIVAGAIEQVEAIVAESPHTASHAAASPTQAAPRAGLPRAGVGPPIDPPSADQALPAENAPEVPQATPVLATTQSSHGSPTASAQVEPSSGPSAYPMPTTLAEEVRTLDQARRALASGDVEAAEHLLDAYDLHIATPRLRPEAIVLRIETLLAEGRRDRARQLGERLLAEDPEGAYTQHVRSLLADAAR